MSLKNFHDVLFLCHVHWKIKARNILGLQYFPLCDSRPKGSRESTSSPLTKNIRSSKVDIVSPIQGGLADPKIDLNTIHKNIYCLKSIQRFYCLGGNTLLKGLFIRSDTYNYPNV